MDINLDKKMFNEKYLPIMKSRKRHKIIYGGSGSGKSYFIATMLLIKLLQAKGVNVLVVRKVDNTLRISVFNLFKQIISGWKLNNYFTIRETDMRISCINGNEIICKGLNDRENIKSITFENGNLTDIWIEEASEVDKEDYLQLNLRLRGEDGIAKQIILSFNPISSESWIKKTFFDAERTDVEILKTTYRDNKYIDKTYAQTLEQLKIDDPVYWDVYCNGNWGVIDSTNVVIPMKLLINAKTNNNVQESNQIFIGADIARYGDDTTVFYYRKGNKVFEPDHLSKTSIPDSYRALKQRIVDLQQRFPNCRITVNIDETGLGAGVLDMIKDDPELDHISVFGINFSQKTQFPEKYENITSEMLFNVRNILTNEDVIIPDHEKTIGELSGRLYEITPKGKYKVERKADYKKRTGKSPDFADAFILMFHKQKEVVFI